MKGIKKKNILSSYVGLMYSTCITDRQGDGHMQEYGRLRELRYEAKLSQQEIAKILHCTQVAYSLYESGKRKISVARLVILARLYQTSVDYLIGLVNEREPAGPYIDDWKEIH
ncbi:MAG: helix-turn-helix transcriptional regulator [Caecibacter sp.]|jgi:DNA-binding XRE family transcriptional regulator|nr:helix-turn-helix transcriptional regulator [Caecibacter sp.]